MFLVFKKDVNEILPVYVQQMLTLDRGEAVDQQEQDDVRTKLLSYLEACIDSACVEGKNMEPPEALAHVRARLVEVFS